MKNKSIIEKISILGITAIASFMLLILSYWSLRFTTVMNYEAKAVATQVDNLPRNILWEGIVFFSLIIVYFAISSVSRCVGANESDRAKTEKYLVTAILFVVTTISIIWVTLSKTLPNSDSGMLVDCAAAIADNNFNSFESGQYLEHNPHQLGLILILEIIYRIFGNGNYLAFMYLNALSIPLLLFSGYRFVAVYSNNMATRIMTPIMMGAFVPITIYSTLIYGESLSTALVMTIIWLTAELVEADTKVKPDTGIKTDAVINRNSVYRVLLISILSGVTCTIRKNSLIAIIAVVIILLVKQLGNIECVAIAKKPRVSAEKEDRKRVACLPTIGVIVLFAFSLLLPAAVKKSYEIRIGHKIEAGIPVKAYIGMGFQNPEDGDGWFEGYAYRVFEDNGFDNKKTDAAAGKELARIAEDMKARPRLYSDFIKRKLRSQWNDPIYSSIFETRKRTVEDSELPRLTAFVYGEEGKYYITKLMDKYQLILFGLMLLSLIGPLMKFALKQKKMRNKVEAIACVDSKSQLGSTLGFYLPFLCFIGGFLFSIVWEAKSRYVFPYFVWMIPGAVFGLEGIVEIIIGAAKCLRKQNKTN